MSDHRPDPTPPQTPPTIPGMTLLRCRGAGSTGEVHSARREVDGWICAVKVIREGTPLTVVRREIEILTAVRVDGLVRCHDLVTTSTGGPALVLDLVDGGVLREIVRARGKLTTREVLGVLRALLAVLRVLHRSGISHGDLAATNVLVSREGRAVLGDLGSARLVGEHPGPVHGTSGFIAPEMTRGGSPTPASDVYGVGAIAWLMLTGQVPGSAFGRLPVSEALAEAPQELGDLVADCLSGDPAQRPTASEALARCRLMGADEPIGLPDGPDLGGQLTHRLPVTAERPMPAVIDDLTAGHQPMPLHPGDSRQKDPSLSGELVGRHRSSKDPHVVSVLASTCARALYGATGRATVAAAVGAGVGLSLWWATAAGMLQVPGTFVSWGSAQAAHAAPVHQQSPPEAPTESAGAEEPDVKEQKATAPENPTQALPRLLALRAGAYAQADPHLLEQCYASDAPGLARARAEVELLRSRGVRYDGLSYQVSDLTITADQRTDDPARVKVSASVATSPYRVVSASGGAATVTQERPAAGTRLTYVLRRTAKGWKLAAVEE